MGLFNLIIHQDDTIEAKSEIPGEDGSTWHSFKGTQDDAAKLADRNELQNLEWKDGAAQGWGPTWK